MNRYLPVLLVVIAVGCGKHDAKIATERETGEHTHSHERDKLLLADFGSKMHAGLTAHLSSKSGHELDVFIEAANEAHSPTPLPLAKFTAQARTSDGKTHELVFEPTEMDERKDDPPGKCSHFVAKAPWLNPAEAISLTASIELDGKPREVTWSDFLPSKYAHHVE